MAKLKATPKNFAEAVAVLKDKISLRLGNNTYLNQFITGRVYQKAHQWYLAKAYDWKNAVEFTEGIEVSA